MNHLYKSVFAGIYLLWLLAACSSDELGTKEVPQNGQAIRFSTNIGSEAKEASRAVGQTWAEHDQVGIFMIDEAYTTIHAANALYLTQSQGSKVALAAADGHELYFPQTGEVRFIGYYPYNEEITSVDDTYTYPVTLGNQSDTAPFDLLWYKDITATGLFNKDIGNPSIDFKHQLSKIVINLYLDNGMEGHTIESANLVNIPTTAMFNLQTGAISDHANKGDVDFITSTLTQKDTEAGIIQRFEAIIIPHTGEETEFTSRTLTFGVTDPVGETMTLPWEIQDDKTFETNKLYTYNFTLTQTAVDFMGVTINDWNTTEIDENLESDNLRLSEIARSVPKEGYTGTLGIKTSYDDTPIAVSSDESWLTVADVTGSNGKYFLTYTAGANLTEEIRRATITITAGAMEITSEIRQSIYDITSGTVVASANSIVLVTGGETVLIPITIVNEPATYPGVSDGRDIYVKPFSDSDLTSFEAKVLWIDSPNFAETELQTTIPTDIIAEVGEVYATLDQSYLLVKPGTHQGNAVVCITKPGTDEIIWSWHIWVVNPEDRALMWIKDSAENTTYMDKPEPTANGYAFFPLHLGAFNAAGATNTFTSTDGWLGHPFAGLYYQWGRKDPFPNRVQPSWIGNGLEGINLPHINTVSMLSGGGRERTGLRSIKYPYSHSFSMAAPDGWLGTIHLTDVTNNSWGDCSTYGYNNKSPFDPCPAGWRIPPGKVSYGVAPYAWKGVDDDNCAVWFASSDSPYGIAGYLMENYGGFYPVSGSRFGLGETNGYCWCASPSTTYVSDGYNFFYRKEFSSWGRSDYRYHGLSVRCVTE